MKPEDKELLIKDLCARLPYGVICTDSRHGDSEITEIDTVAETVYCNDFDEYVELDKCKPYLRSMDLMIEEEKSSYHKTQWEYQADYCAPEYFDGLESYDWLNAHHFDYRGLIEKGLALQAPKGMYK